MLFCVIYRTGGTERFSWHRTLSANRDEAEKMQDEVRHQGYRALVVGHTWLDHNGLPDTYVPDPKYLGGPHYLPL